MAEYIEKDALIKEGWHLERTKSGDGFINIERREIKDIPAADVRPVRKGSWYGSGDGYADGHLVIDEWECPCCGKYFQEWDEKPDWNFCPNCGADMREVTHET